MQIQEPVSSQVIAEIAKEVVARLRAEMRQPQSSAASSISVAAPRDGVFSTVDEAVNAAFEAQKKVADMGLEERGRMIDIIRRICRDRREELGRMEMEETKVGRLDHKILKLTNMRLVLGVEAMRSDARSDRTGLCIIERAPWGVIGMMLPVTHSVPTMASNAINILAAGNTAVFGPHPSGQKVAQYALQLWNREIERELGVANVVTTVREASIEAAEQIFNHPKIALLCVTGGSAVAKAAAKSGKRVIAGGPGNPPVVVDERIAKTVPTKPRRKSASLWTILAVPAMSVLIVSVAVNFYVGRESERRQRVFSELADLHVAALASAAPVDVVSTDRHTVKPWFQGKIPFSFNLPELQGSEFTLLGGRVTYLAQTPGAHLIYQVRKHEVSVFIFQDRGEEPASLASGPVHTVSFNVENWTQNGLRYFVVGDVSADDIQALGKLLRDAR